MKETLSIGTASAKPRTKGTGFVRVANRPDGSEIGIPIMIVNGADDGAVIVADAGVHGDEFEGMEAIRRVADALDPNRLRGAFVGIPCLNVLAFEAGFRSSHIDWLNLNRVFPGRAPGTGFVTENIAYAFEHEIMAPTKDLTKCYVTFHGGGTGAGGIQAIGPCVPYDEGTSSVDQKSAELAKIFGIDLLVTAIGGWPPNGTGDSTAIATKLGIPSVCPEVGGEARLSEELIEIDVRGLDNLMTYFDMIDGQLKLPQTWTWVAGPVACCTKGGFWRASVKVRQNVSKGDLIGTTISYFGDIVEIFESPHDGIVCCLRSTASVYPGEWYGLIGSVKRIFRREDLKVG